MPGSDEVADAGRLTCRVFNEKDGLLQNTINAIAVDPKGYIWAATQDGAAYYNGRTWTSVDMPNRNLGINVLHLVVLSDGGMWFGTRGGGAHHLKDGMWTTHTVASGALPSDGVNCILEAVERDAMRSLYLGTNRGLVRARGGVWTRFDGGLAVLRSRIACLLQTTAPDGARTLWVGTDGGLAQFDGDRWTVYDAESGLPNNAVTALLETTGDDGETVLWVGTESGGVARLEGGRWTRFDTTSGLPSNSISSLLETKDAGGTRTVWVGMRSGGLARFARGTWTTFSRKSGLPSDGILSLLETVDANGISTLWVGTYGGGVARIRFGGWTSFDTTSGLVDNHVWQLLETTGTDGAFAMWAVTNAGGLARYEDGTWTTVDRRAELTDNSVLCLLETTTVDGERILWAGTRGGLARMERGVWTTLTTASGLPSNFVACLLETADSDGTCSLWVGTTRGGLARLKNGQLTVFDSTSGLPSNVIFDIVETRARDGASTLWVSTDSGLCRYQRETWTTFTTDSGLPSNLVGSLSATVSPDGRRTLWVATLGGGAAWLDLDAARPVCVPLRVNLPSESVAGIRQDAKGRIYLCTFRGIVRLTPRTPTRDRPEEFEEYTFTTGDGMPSDDVNSRATMVDSRGRLWVGTTDGIGVFDPSRQIEDRAPKPLYVERVLLGDRPLGRRGKGDAGDQRLPTGVDLAGLSLAHDENDLTFEYALLSGFKTRDTSYRTQLVGFDLEPSDWSAEYKRVYTNLEAGEYRFKVWGRDYAGNVTEAETASFTIRRAPWRTWWAYGLYAVALAGAGYGGVRARLAAAERQKRLLEAQVAARTAEISQQAERLKVSELRALDLAEAAQAANRAKSVFLANMSHQLRTPLNAVLGFAQLMERDRSMTAEQRENLAIILRSGEHLLGLINDVLSISKIEAGRLSLVETSFDLVGLLREVEEMMRVRADARNLALHVEREASLPRYVVGDAGKLRQVLVNLLGNAVKFTQAGSVTLRAQWSDGRGYFDVEDTGPGIAETEIGTLFDPFVQTRSGERAKEGTGLGLVISRNIVLMMGGELYVESVVGRGSVFRFEVALREGEEPDPAASTRRVVGVEEGQEAVRILVADDKRENRMLLVKLLTGAGFEVREATNGREAVDIWEVWGPHLIWMDVRMPVMGGLEATQWIRAIEIERGTAERTKVVALTASAFEHDRRAILEVGCDAFVAKPCREQAIFDALGEQLGVRFVYEGADGDGGPSHQKSVLSVERLAALDADVLEGFAGALRVGDGDGALLVVEAIREADEALAAELERMVKSFAYDRLITLLDEFDETTGSSHPDGHRPEGG